MTWLATAGLCLAPLPVGVVLGYLAATLLDWREVRALARAYPAGLPLSAVPWHLREHFTAANRGDRLPG